MTTTQVSVPTGTSATLISSGFPSGNVIYNTDSKNTVWVSSNPSVAAGQGTPVAPLGSVTWSASTAVYAVVDKGVTSPVVLTLSTDATNVDNPVAVGTAVAAELLSQGVPSVLVGANISGIVNAQPFGVSGYASVAGTIDVPAAGYILIQYMDPTLSVVLFQKYYTFAGSYTQWPFSLPVYGPEMIISYVGAGGGGGPLSVSLYGTNRILPAKSYSDWQINNSLNQAFTAGTLYSVGTQFSTDGGPASFNIRCTPAVQTAKGVFGYQYYSNAGGAPGSLKTMQLCDTTQMHIDDSGTNYSIYLNDVRLPAGVLQPTFQPDAAISSGIVVITGIVP